MKVCILTTDFKEPWDEGGKNNIRAIVDHIGQDLEFSFLGLSDRDERRTYRGWPVQLVRTPGFGHPIGRIAYPVGCLRLLRRAQDFLREHPADLLFSYLETASSALLGRLIRRLACPRARLVHAVWNDWYQLRSAPLHAWLTEHLPNLVMNNAALARLGLSGADSVVATSQYLCDRVRDLGFDRPQYISTGVDTQTFRLLRPVSSGPPWTIGYLGHLTHAKGVSDLLEAVLPLLEPMDVTLRLAVTNGEEEAALAAVRGARVKVEGLVAPQEFFNDCDLVVIPRRSSYGAVSYPNTLLEAMACGRAVLVTDLPAIREVVVDGENSILCPPERPDILRKKVQEVLADPVRLREMGRRARETMEASFAWDVLARTTRDLLRGLREC